MTATQILTLLFLILYNSGFGQDQKSVLWQFEGSSLERDEAIVTLKAMIAPGWHLYSQFMKDGGPMPTRFSFEECEDYLLEGQMEEKGKPVKFYDDTYEMEITWYGDTVSFIQHLKLRKPVATIKGIIEYMSCNDHTCVPGQKEFTIKIQPSPKTF